MLWRILQNDGIRITIIVFVFHHGGGSGKTRIIEIIMTRVVLVAHVVVSTSECRW
jgi:hypothetical protein